MKYESLELLCCPVCRGKLSYYGPGEGGVIREGRLHSKECGRTYPIREGIPRFTAPKELVGFNRKYAVLYNWISRFYDSEFLLASRVRRRFWPAGEMQARSEVVERLEINAYGRVLETGIGTGGNVPHILGRARTAQVYGLDISIGMLKQCVGHLGQWKLEAELFLGNAERLPFHDDAFDVVFHLGAINVFTEQKQALEEMIRVAKSGTRIVIADETERAADTGPVSRLGWSLFFGKPMYADILAFRPQNLLQFVPGTMLDVRFDYIWLGNGYRLEFRKP